VDYIRTVSDAVRFSTGAELHNFRGVNAIHTPTKVVLTPLFYSSYVDALQRHCVTFF